MTTKTFSSMTPELLAATTVLAAQLLQSAPVVALHQAQAQLAADPAAQASLKRLARIQAGLRAPPAGTADLADQIEDLHRQQEQVNSNATIQAVALSQQAARASLGHVNRELSQILEFDFATYAKRPGCC
jgi:cell fate (sporulation/competence/biofilm development) regulator YlbF (YheA/YmcA/DUF963 family)